MSSQSGHKTSWNDRYKSKIKQPLYPEQFLIDHLSFLKPGSVLDIACGEGPNSVFLSQKGFKVSAIDFSEIALDRLRNSSNENNLNIETIEMDLSKNKKFKMLKKLKRFDNIIIIHFRLSDDLLELIPSLLNNGGILLYCTFNQRQLEIKTFPEEFCLREGELVNKKWALKLLKFTSFENERGYHDGYLFKR